MREGKFSADFCERGGKFRVNSGVNFAACRRANSGENKICGRVLASEISGKILLGQNLTARSDKNLSAQEGKIPNAKFSLDACAGKISNPKFDANSRADGASRILNLSKFPRKQNLKFSPKISSSAKNLDGLNLGSLNFTADLKAKFSPAAEPSKNECVNLGRGLKSSDKNAHLNFASRFCKSSAQNARANVNLSPKEKFSAAVNLNAPLNLSPNFKNAASQSPNLASNLSQNAKSEISKPNFACDARENEGEYAIDVRGLCKKFGSKIITDAIDIRVKKGSVCGFLGPNGSGKTTAIRMLCGLLKPDGGSGRCLGYDFRRDGELIRLKTGYMTQRFGWYDDLSVRENLEFMARLFELKDQKSAVAGVLERLSLAPRQNHLAGSLSGGWKQRLALGMCLVHDPELLLLDEPTAGVDPKARREFWDIIHALAREGITALVSTHYMDEAERCHELIYIAYGKILARGTQPDIIASYDLDVWELGGARAGKVASKLASHAAVQSVSAFGGGYHVTTRDAAGLQSAVASLGGGEASLKPIKASLEDVFIHLLESRKDERY